MKAKKQNNTTTRNNAYMKNTPYKYIKLIGLHLSMCLIACESKEQAPTDEFELVKQHKEAALEKAQTQAKPAANSSINTPSGIIPQAANIPAKTHPHVDACDAFLREMEQNISVNEKIIQRLKNGPEQKTKLQKKINQLERENTGLKRGIYEYKEDVRMRRENYRLSTSHSLGQINNELTELENNLK